RACWKNGVNNSLDLSDRAAWRGTFAQTKVGKRVKFIDWISGQSTGAAGDAASPALHLPRTRP
ncbi:hypothetical protein ABTK28_22245, partial [Acinetobacter baumannii]